MIRPFLSLTNNRHENFKKWISIEIADFLESHYNLKPKEDWTIGGFSNGGAFVTSLIESSPNSFRNIICMSPGTVSTRFHSDKYIFYICAGKEELSFYSTSLYLARTLEKKGVEFEHRTYSCGHDYNMWLSYYIYCLRKIYKVSNKT
jgi:predicted esterase